MDWLNYHHLLYFWTVAREGGIGRAAETLRLSQPTISAQIRTLEASLGQRLFDRQGRRLVLTDVGQVVFGYADEIFGIGRELVETLRGRPPGRPVQLTVGVANAVPKLVVQKLLRPAFEGDERVRLVCLEDNPEQLVARLATHSLDVVIADVPAPPHVRVKVFNHLLGESATAFFAPAPIARKLARRFPASLDGAPILLPTSNTLVRRDLDHWFEREGLHPQLMAEFEDSALMKIFGREVGMVFPAPVAIADEVCRLYGVKMVGQTSGVVERYYAISAERRVKHPGVLAITSAARDQVFGSAARRPGGGHPV